MDKSQWWDKSWNPMSGCDPISTGCKFCYAKRMAIRMAGRVGYAGTNPFAISYHPERLKNPLIWRKPQKIFTVSMGDLFHQQVTYDFRAQVFDIMRQADWHTFILTTKRPENMADFVLEYLDCLCLDSLPPNIWLGASCENAEAAWSRLPYLMQLYNHCEVVWCSYEPMLGPIDFTPWLLPKKKNGPCLDWIVAGAETGPQARPYHPEWALKTQQDCENAGLPFYFKSWGEWLRFDCTAEMMNLAEGRKNKAWVHLDGEVIQPIGNGCRRDPLTVALMMKIGAKRAGRMMNGREFNEFPEVV